jgi:hypothetical protein
VIDTSVMLKLMEMRQESLRRMKERMAQATEVDVAAPNGGPRLGTPAPGPVPPLA